MKARFLTLVAAGMTWALDVSAHESVVPHHHPHGPSAIVGTQELVLLIAAAVAIPLLHPKIRATIIEVFKRRRG